MRNIKLVCRQKRLWSWVIGRCSNLFCFLLAELNSINGILTIVTLSKNSIRVLCESREQPNLDKVLRFPFQLYSIIPVIARNTNKSTLATANLLSECIPQFRDFIQIGHFRSTVLIGLVCPLAELIIFQMSYAGMQVFRPCPEFRPS